jgi:hypothetical protein
MMSISAMPRIGTRARFIIRKDQYVSHVDPSQWGGHTARLVGGQFTLFGIRNSLAFKAPGVLAARWENEETILLVIREEAEDDPTVVRAFKPRIQRNWDTEDAHAEAHLPPEAGGHLAIQFMLPSPQVIVLPMGRVVRDFEAVIKLGAAPSAVEWLPDGRTLRVVIGDHIHVWSVGMKQFKRLPQVAE